MPKLHFYEKVQEICAKDSRYDAEAYSFVQSALDFTLKSLKRTGQSSHRHVTGQELLIGLRDSALKEYGPMSKTVLNEWGIKTCEDFGQIVFNLVSSEILGKTDSDSPEDFKNGFSFEEAFVKPFMPKAVSHSPKPTSSTRSKRPSSKKSSAKQI
jgi:uncharacterized repeat protein (TIGR04138 family)